MTLEKKTMHHFLIEIEVQQLQVVVQVILGIELLLTLRSV